MGSCHVLAKQPQYIRKVLSSTGRGCIICTGEIKSRNGKCATHAEHKGDIGNENKILFENPEGRRPLGKLMSSQEDDTVHVR
jgi:hypothetical protein